MGSLSGVNASSENRRRRRGSLAAGLLLAAVSLLACTKSATLEGKPIPAERVSGIVAGQTTEEEIREWFGPPADVVVTDTGKVLTYRYSKSSGGVLSIPFLGIGGGVASGQMLIVTLDGGGRVVRHTFIGGP